LLGRHFDRRGRAAPGGRKRGAERKPLSSAHPRGAPRHDLPPRGCIVRDPTERTRFVRGFHVASASRTSPKSVHRLLPIIQ
jgi:hypothetical protein